MLMNTALVMRWGYADFTGEEKKLICESVFGVGLIPGNEYQECPVGDSGSSPVLNDAEGSQ
jgi:hypothetical protein